MKLLYISILLCFSFLNYGQQYLQLETKNDPFTLKFEPGDKICFKTDGAEGWQIKTIEKFILSDSLIMFADGYQHISKFKKLRIPRHVVGAISNKLMQFGVVWTAYMLIGEPFIDGKQITVTASVIGAGSFVGGWIFKKLFYQRKYKIGTRYRLRLLDLTMEAHKH